MRKVFALIAVFSVAIIGVAGCAGIPRSGSVHAGVEVGATVDNEVQFLPAGPIADASPEDILRGFVDAATSPADDWGIARTFLTSDYQAQWQPSRGVMIDRGTRIVASSDSDSYSLEVTQLAHVDEWGLYSDGQPTTATLDFTMTQENGQWRIAAAPDGIILDANLFPQVFSETQLYFYEANFQRLVPDNRWFPARSSTATRAVKALLQGPARWMSLSGGVVSAFPPGALLVADSVPIDESTAVVNFDVKSLAANDVTLQRMVTQLAASFASVPGITRARMVLSGARQLEADVPLASTLLSSTYLTSPTVLTGQVFGSIGATAGSVQTALSKKIVQLRPAIISMAASQNEVATLIGGQAMVIGANSGARIVDKRAGLVAPVIDTYGYVWTAPALVPAAVHVSPAPTASTGLRMPWTRATSLVALAVSPEGSRVVASYRVGSKFELCVASIRRNAANAPVEVGPCLLIPIEATEVGPVAWIDASRLGVVTYTATTSTIHTVRLGGLTTMSQVNARVVTITGSGPALVARVLTAEGDVLQQVSSPRWYLVATGVDALASVQ